MWLRILLAGVVGGVLMFCMGFVGHAVLGLQGRAIDNLPDSAGFIDDLKERKLAPGLYFFPDMPKGADERDAAKLSEANQRYKAGPAGMLLVMPPGHDMMTPDMLFWEWFTNTVAALAAAWVVSLMGPDVGYDRRCGAVLAMGVIGWVSIAASYGIWYHFPHDFVHDELYCVLLEWSVAACAIAGIVRRRPMVPISNPPESANP